MGYRRHIVIQNRAPARRSTLVPPPPPPPPQGLLLDSKVGSVATPYALVAGHLYTLVVDGTYTLWNVALGKGHPEPVAMYPTSGSRTSTQVGIDAETLFAQPDNFSHPFGHWTYFQVNLGAGYGHVEPVGGPYSTPQPGHAYTYHVTGRGVPASFRVADTGKLGDNYGALRIVVS